MSTIQRPLDHYNLQDPSPSPKPAVSSGGDGVVVSPATVYVATATTTDSTSSLPIGAVQSLHSPSITPFPNDSMSPINSSPAPLPPPGAGLTSSVNGSDDPEVDEAILQALRSPKERLFMLMLGESMETLINDRRQVKSAPTHNPLPSRVGNGIGFHADPKPSLPYQCDETASS